jgi:putative transcriptional regulator
MAPWGWWSTARWSLNLADILEQLRPEIDPPASCQAVPIYFGGPVQTDRGFVLHPSRP